jgi:DNA repair exonuclease SbcCD ATPase subunit
VTDDKTDDKADDKTDDDDADDGGDDTEKVEVAKAEYDALQAERARLRREVKKAEKAAKEAETKKAEDEGKWKELAEERERKVAETERKLAEVEKRTSVSKVAKRMDFRDPDDVFRFLDDDDLDDEASIKRALTALKDDKPYLTGDPKQPGGPTRTRNRETKTDPDKAIRSMAGR